MQEDGDNLSHEEFMALQLAALEQYERNRMPTVSEHEKEGQREQVKVCTHITVNECMLLSFLQYPKQLLNYTYLTLDCFGTCFFLWWLQTSSPPLSVALRDISVQDLSVILANLSLPTLVDPFQRNGMSGNAIARISAYQDIIDISKTEISKVVAESFFEDHVLKWKQSGSVPKVLLQPPSSTSSSAESKFKVRLVTTKLLLTMPYIFT